MQKYIFYNYGLNCLMTTRVYDSYYEATKIAEQYNNVIVLIIEII